MPETVKAPHDPKLDPETLRTAVYLRPTRWQVCTFPLQSVVLLRLEDEANGRPVLASLSLAATRQIARALRQAVEDSLNAVPEAD